MADNTNRTFICSVLFLDIVEYSRRGVTEQLKLKEQFNTVLSEAISGVAVDDRIILDTGDGAAVSFLGDPEDAMFVALSMRDAVASQPAEGPLLRVRFGINLGPVRLIKDINGQPNIIGDGINVAQRIMTFAEPGQILVSRSYYDIIARLSEDYANLFHYEGARTDKHVREHEVYAVGAAPRRLRSRTLPPPPTRARSGIRRGRFHPAKWAGALAVDRKLLVIAPLAFVFIVGSAFAVRSYRKSDPAPSQSAAAARAVRRVEPAKIAALEQPALPASRAESPARTSAPEQRPAPQARPTAAKTPVARTAPQPRSEAKFAPAEEKRVARRQEVAVAAPAEARPSVSSASQASARVTLSVLPWAEVYVDGRKLGVSPPLHSIPLAAGKHQIELRNGSFPVHRATLDAKPGQSIIVRHRFD